MHKYKKQLQRIVKLLISIGYYIVIHLARAIRFLLRKKNYQQPVILYYHEIPRRYCENFQRQMLMLTRTADPIKLEDIAATYSQNKRAAVAVTFDDAFRSVKDNGLLALVAYSIPATIFVPTAYLGKNPGWIKDENSPLNAEMIMTKQELLDLPRSLISFGSHTHSHPHLSQLTQDALKQELSQSKQELEALFSKEITGLAFPHGDYNESVLHVAHACGYKQVYTINPNPPVSKEDCPFIYGRLAAYPWDSRLEFYLKIKGCYSWLPVAINLKKKILGKQGRNLC